MAYYTSDMSDESDLQREIMSAVTAAGGRVFRNNTGMGWAGQIVADIQTGRGRVVSIGNPRPLHAGLCRGSSDLVGWFRGRFLAIECKTQRGRVSAEQQNFIDVVNSNGGIGIIARSSADVLSRLRSED